MGYVLLTRVDMILSHQGVYHHREPNMLSKGCRKAVETISNLKMRATNSCPNTPTNAYIIVRYSLTDRASGSPSHSGPTLELDPPSELEQRSSKRTSYHGKWRIARRCIDKRGALVDAAQGPMFTTITSQIITVYATVLVGPMPQVQRSQAQQGKKQKRCSEAVHCSVLPVF